jgi:ABC-type uncharacterized transport system auxiliary subunit
MQHYTAGRGMRQAVRAMIVAAGCCALGACIGLRQPAHKISHYTLEYAPPAVAGLERQDMSLRIERFTAAAAYATSALVYRDASFKREEYVYHKWRAYPGDIVACCLGRDLQQAGFLQGVFLYGSSFAAPLVLEGSVDEFVAWESESGWEAVLGITVTVLANDEPDITKKILLQKTYRSRKPCERMSPQSFVEAMSSAMAEVSGSVIQDVSASLKKSSSAPAAAARP